MTLLLVEGYENSSASMVGRYASGSLRDTGTGRSGTGTAARPNSQAFQLRPADESDTLILGGAFKWDGNDNREFLNFQSDGGTTNHVALWFRSTGQIVVRRGSGSGATALGTTAITTPLVAGVWYYVEVKVKLHDTLGTVDVRVGEVNVLSLTAQDTKNSGTKTVFDRIVLLCFDTWADDIYLCNTAGVRNDFLGDCVVEGLLPSGDGATSQLLGSDGNSTSNYALVDEATPDTADYVGSATTGEKDTYAFSNLAHPLGTVLGVSTVVYAAKTDAGARSIRAVTRVGGTDYPGSDASLSTTYAAYSEVLELDPSTVTAWTVSSVNGAEFGVEVRA